MTTANPPAVQTHWVFMKPVKITGQIFSDQTGRFPITSSRGNKYIMVVYDYDWNAILTEPLTSRTEMELLHAYTKIHTFLTKCGLKPVLQKLDNKAPGKLQSFMRQNDVSFQFVPLRQHQCNTAKRAIATWKGSLCSNPRYHRSILPAPFMVPPHRPSIHHTQSLAPITDQSAPAYQPKYN
jgi:hypothetical protein